MIANHVMFTSFCYFMRIVYRIEIHLERKGKNHEEKKINGKIYDLALRGSRSISYYPFCEKDFFKKTCEQSKISYL